MTSGLQVLVYVKHVTVPRFAVSLARAVLFYFYILSTDILILRQLLFMPI